MKLGAIFLILLVGIPVFFVGWMIKVDIEVQGNISAWYDRACTAPTAERMAYFLDELTLSMERYGMTSGYAALIYKNPKSDMAVIHPLLLELRDRALEVEKYPQGSMDYAESMEDIIRRMHDFEFSPFWWYRVNHTPKAVLAWWMFAYLILLGPLLILAMVTWDTNLRCALGRHKWDRDGECVRCYKCDRGWNLRDELEIKTPSGMAKLVVSTVPLSDSEHETTVSGTLGDKKLAPYQERNRRRGTAVKRHNEIMERLRLGEFTLSSEETKQD